MTTDALKNYVKSSDLSNYITTTELDKKLNNYLLKSVNPFFSGEDLSTKTIREKLITFTYKNSTELETITPTYWKQDKDPIYNKTRIYFKSQPIPKNSFVLTMLHVDSEQTLIKDNYKELFISLYSPANRKIQHFFHVSKDEDVASHPHYIVLYAPATFFINYRFTLLDSSNPTNPLFPDSLETQVNCCWLE